MAVNIKLYTRNILETAGSVTVTGTPDAGYPEARLYDRSISLYWKDTATQAYTFLVDQSTVTAKSVDFLAMEKHNFSTQTMHWQYSTSSTAWANASTWLQSGTTQIVKTISTALTKGYWQVVTGSKVNPQCGEVYMSYGYDFPALIDHTPLSGEIDNVQWNKTIGGVERGTKFGAMRRNRQYTALLSSTQLTDFRAAMDELSDYAKPFYIRDHLSNYYMVRLTEVPQEEYKRTKDGDRAYITIRLLEML